MTSVGPLTSLRSGVYLVHNEGKPGATLHRVLKAQRGELWLEDCRYPELPPETLSAVKLRDGTWRAVRPTSSEEAA